MEVIVRRKADYNDELAHHKYIEKKKINGKWRYYYDIGTTGDIVNGSKRSSVKDYSKLQDILGYDERDAFEVANVNYNRALKDLDGQEDLRRSETESYRYNPDVHEEMRKNKTVAQKAISEAVDKYKNTPIGKLDILDDKIDDARNRIADALIKLIDKSRPDEERLNYQYKRKYTDSGVKINRK